MDRYHKMFVQASIIYLIIGMALGYLMGIGVLDPLIFRFAHIHLNLLGFGAMMIFGVAYHILPRFNGKPLKSQNLVIAHFFTGNIGLVGMVIFSILRVQTDNAAMNSLFNISAILSGIAIILFAVNIMPVLTNSSVEDELQSYESINRGSTISQILKKWPEVEPVFINNSIAVKNWLGKYHKISLAEACQKTNTDEDVLIATLQMMVRNIEKQKSTSGVKDRPNIIGKPQAKIKRGELARKEVLAGDVLEIYPETRPIFQKYYGESCFTCPGQAYESIQETTEMHNVPIDKFLNEINETIKKAVNK